MKFYRKKHLDCGRMSVAVGNRQTFPAVIENALERSKKQDVPEKTVTASISYNQSSYHVKTNVNQKLLGYEGALQNVQTDNLRNAVATWSNFYESKDGVLNFEFSKNKKGGLSTKLWYTDLPQDQKSLPDPTKYIEG